MAGSYNKQKLPKNLQFSVFSDEKLRMALIGLADKYDEMIRNHIYKVYSDPIINATYREIRNSGIYEQGSRTGAKYRKIINFPDRYVFDFCDTVMTALYGSGWLNNNQALMHELVRPWLLVTKL